MSPERPLSSIFYFLSFILYLLSSMFHVLTPILYLPSSIFYLQSSIFYFLSSNFNRYSLIYLLCIFCLLSYIFHLISSSIWHLVFSSQTPSQPQITQHIRMYCYTRMLSIRTHLCLLVFAEVFPWCHFKPMHLCTNDVDEALKQNQFFRSSNNCTSKPGDPSQPSGAQPAQLSPASPSSPDGPANSENPAHSHQTAICMGYKYIHMFVLVFAKISR